MGLRLATEENSFMLLTNPFVICIVCVAYTLLNRWRCTTNMLYLQVLASVEDRLKTYLCYFIIYVVSISITALLFNPFRYWSRLLTAKPDSPLTPCFAPIPAAAARNGTQDDAARHVLGILGKLHSCKPNRTSPPVPHTEQSA